MSDLYARVALLERMVSTLMRRQGAAMGFARSTAPPVDTGAVQTIQGQMDAITIRDQMPVLFHYGFSSAMPVGGDKLVAFLNGNRSSAVVFATNHQTYRLTYLATGEVAIYDMWGRSIKLGAGGIAVNCGSVPMVITGDVHVTGSIQTTGYVIAGYGGGDQVGLQTHIHVVPEHAGNSSAPIAGT